MTNREKLAEENILKLAKINDVKFPSGPFTEQERMSTLLAMNYGYDAGFKDAKGENTELMQAVREFIDYYDVRASTNDRSVNLVQVFERLTSGSAT